MSRLIYSGFKKDSQKNTGPNQFLQSSVMDLGLFDNCCSTGMFSLTVYSNTFCQYCHGKET